MMAAGPVADHRALAAPERFGNLVVMPTGQLAWRDAPAVVQLRQLIRGPDAGRPIERRPQVVVEELPSRRNQHLVEGSEQTGVAARKEEAVETGPCQCRRSLDERVPGA